MSTPTASPLTESAFLTLADQTLSAIEAAVEGEADRVDADIDMRRSGNVLQMDFENGTSIIVNSQAPMQEMWVAARAGGFHFRYVAGQWLDTRSGQEMYAALSQYVSQQAGASLSLHP